MTADPDFKKKIILQTSVLKKKKVEAAWDAVATRWYTTITHNGTVLHYSPIGLPLCLLLVFVI